jgi:hypothetical protein
MTAAIAPLTRRQTLILAVIGAVLWLAFALLIRVLGPMGVFDGSNRIWLYLVVIPGTLPIIPVIRRLAGLGPNQHTIGMAVGTASAIMLDGVALSWAPWLYADTVELVAAAGAVILWGGGVGLALGALLDWRQG